VLIYVSNQWSRALPASLVKFGGVGTGREFMNVALDVDAVQYGWLSSYAFTALYAVTSLGAGVACDRFSRGAVLLVAAAGWTIATGLQACATNYPQLVLSRAALGIAQAFCSPAAYPMIGQAFASESRGMANAIYSSGLYVGYAFASLSAILSRLIGWRLTSLVVAAFSATSTLLLGLVLYHKSFSSAASTAASYSSSLSAGTTPPLVATPAAASARASPVDSPKPAAATPAAAAVQRAAPVRTVFGTRSAALLLIASTTRSFGGYAVGAWSLPFFRLYHPDRAANFAVANGVFIAVGASLSTVMGGWLSDRLISRGREGAPADGSTAHRALFVPMCGSLVAIPLWVCVLQTSTFVPAMVALLLSYLVAECWFGALTSTMQGALPQVCSSALGGPSHPESPSRTSYCRHARSRARAPSRYPLRPHSGRPRTTHR
jgi:predicted MFS family arabinose efflux permease